ncbi:MAG TPA: DsrE/DsrF/DrsH-like family protein [Micromonosporaceae bacterium]
MTVTMIETEVSIETEPTPEAAPAIVPDFGDHTPTGRKLAIICSKGTLDMAYPGLILANAALGEGVETHLFFTFWGFDIITKSRMDDLKFTMLGNTATHMPQGLGGLPGMTTLTTHQMRKQIRDIGVPDVPEFLEQIVASGGHLWACRMSADMMHLDESDLYDPVEGIISAADFIEMTEGAQLLFI